MTFVDACAIVSILSGEEDADLYGAALEGNREAFTSPMAAWEAIIILARPEKFDLPFATSHALVVEWLIERGIALRNPSAPATDILALAVSAAEKHGIGRRHLSNLDCFHFAQAASEGAALLTRDVLLRETGLKTHP